MMIPSADQSLGFQNPPKMSVMEIVGMLLSACGLLGILVAFLSNTNETIGFVFPVSALLLAASALFRNGKGDRKNIIFLIGAALISLLMIPIRPASIKPEFILLTFFVLLPVGLIIRWSFKYLRTPSGIHHHGTFTQKKVSQSWMYALVLTGFYILLYWFPSSLHGLIEATDIIQEKFHPGTHSITISEFGKTEYNPWFMYSLFYTMAVLLMGYRFILKYRHSRYQVIRTISVMFFQLIFAFLLPEILKELNAGTHPEWEKKTHYFSYFWPLDYGAFFPENLSSLWASGGLGRFVFAWSIIVSFIAVPVLTWFFGKRWYCSWVCGCGGLAETAGDSFRHLSDKSKVAWKVERYLIYSILGVITGLTILLLIMNPVNHFLGFSLLPEGLILSLKSWYGFFIVSVFAGVIGTGFYPILGSRVWCRFGCPQAAILGWLQKHFSRFRITTNGGQCISCGNCSAYCEMGIDVRSYAQDGKDIVRASCVGCGICAEVCPRGVLKLENGPMKTRNN